jgi:hypothetical protein
LGILYDGGGIIPTKDRDVNPEKEEKNKTQQKREHRRKIVQKGKGYHLTYSEVTLVFFWVVLPEKALLSPEHERRVTNLTRQA